MPRPYTYSADDNGCVLVEIPRNLVPFVAGAVRTLERRWYWASEDDYRRAMTALNDMRGQFAMGCAADIVAAIEKQTRLLDRVFNGTEYTSDGVTVSPEVPEVPNAPEASPESLVSLVRRLWQLGENAATSAPFPDPALTGQPALDAAGGWTARLNAVQGVKDATWFGGGTPVTLSDLYRRDGVTGEDDEGIVNDGLQEVLSTLAAGGSVGDALATLFGTAVDTATDGGVVAVQLAALVANAAATATMLQGLQAVVGELRYLTAGLYGEDSNADPAPVTLLPPVRSLLRYTETTGPGAGTGYSVVDYLRNRLGPASSTAAAPAVASLDTRLANIYNTTRTSGGARTGVADVAEMLLQALGGYDASGTPSGGSYANAELAALVAAIGAISTAPGGFTARDLLGRILLEQTRAADCCEESGGGEPEPAPAPEPSDCGSGFTSVSVVSEYAPGDYSGPDALSEGLAIVPGAGASITDVAAPWAPSRRAFRVTSGTSAYMCLQLTRVPGDVGVYGVGIEGRLSDGSPAFTPGGFAQSFPPASSYTSVLIAEDSGGFDVYWYLTVYRVDTPGGSAAPYSGPPPRIFLTEGTLS